jgi:hypothetical protein
LDSHQEGGSRAIKAIFLSDKLELSTHGLWRAVEEDFATGEGPDYDELLTLPEIK